MSIELMKQRHRVQATLKKQLLVHEGLVLRPYLDSVGKLTIGIGRNLDDRGITSDEAHFLLENDIDGVMADLDAKIPWWKSMSDNRQLVLADMCFNLGINRLMFFRRALEAMRLGAWEGAAAEMLDSLWARQVGERARTLAKMMREG